ncbi:MAG TPA: FeoA family protein [Spirochaetia bacterium]|nr:FeoA family protein [Spirochaetia bacterium]
MESLGSGAVSRPSSDLLELAQMRPGDRALVARIEGGVSFRTRMVSMGIVPGREVEILSGRRHHPFLVRVGTTRVMIGWGMLARVLVTRAVSGQAGAAL